jgi:hypothetical protein
MAIHARRSETHFLRAVVIQRRAFDDRIDLVAVGDGVGETLEHHNPETAAKDRARGLCIERAAMSVRRGDPAFLESVAAFLRKGERDATREGGIALVIEQRGAGLADGDERGGARGVNIQRGALEVELIGGAGGEIVLLVAHHRSQRTHGFNELGVPGDVVCEVGVVAHPREDADRAGIAGGVAARIFERGPCFLEEDALLGVHDLGFLRRDAKECRVKPFRAFDHAARGHVGGIGAELGGIEAGCGQLGVRELRNGLFARENILPKLGDIPCSGKAPGHADDGDSFILIFGRTHGLREISR